ncbi:PucR family transcriptional regulator ligand-binding domain-containing protein [Anaerocolumna sp. AGMB13025]|uniref:PucR family transcriptional regulator n=1 Tax=Anaerocolumna sp. AGMB13025 TaxID=3039116 RepID=UPI00241CD02D|nr:PucR family transcriptional regulator [Anaerocolumna sp. AGMB13025]WFR55554.1 PucR family transcriptional regulator ligand-binding domain-containing protein [Anaerocolumna sp. AGMB13025]
MGLMIRQIVENQLLRGVRLAAGQTGDSNIISWVNVMEILDSPQSIQRGELLVTTGYNLQQEDLYKNLISTLKNNGVSGIAIQPGYYIDEIPDYILKESDQLGFPVLEIPKTLTFSDILRILIQKINTEKSENIISDEAAKIMFQSMQENLKQYTSVLFEEDSGKVAHLFYLKPINLYAVSETIAAASMNRIKSYLTDRADSCEYHMSKNGISSFLILFESEAKYLSMIYDFSIELTFLSEQQGINYYVGVDRIKSMESLYLAFEHVTECTELLQFIHAKRGVCSYDNMTFMKMFGILHQNEHSFVSDNQALQILLNYDRINQTNYVQTLRFYLADSCNASKTASRLFIHRHTLQKRLEKINDLCGINPDDYYARLYMSISLLFHDYFAF